MCGRAGNTNQAFVPQRYWGVVEEGSAVQASGCTCTCFLTARGEALDGFREVFLYSRGRLSR